MDINAVYSAPPSTLLLLLTKSKILQPEFHYAICLCVSRQARRNEFKIGAAIQSRYLLSMKVERAERLTAWGPGARSRASGGVQGQSPRKLLGFSICKRPGKTLLEIFFSLNQPRSGIENVSIK